MSKTVQWKRGNANVSASYIGPQGEITVNTDDYSLNLHDGLTPGGFKISNDLDTNVNIGNLVITNQTISNKNSGQNIVVTATNAAVQLENIVINDQTLQGNTSGQDIVLAPTNANLRLDANVFTIANSLSLIADTANNFSILQGTAASANDIKIQATDGTYSSTIYLWSNLQRMSFNTISNAFDFNFNGQLSATDFTASKNSPYGYSFYTPGQGYAGFSHVNGSPEYLRISFANIDHTKYFANATTQTVGNLVISSTANVFGSFPNAFVQVYSNVNSYAQMVMQNLNGGSESSADFIATSNDGNDSTYFLDLGIASSTYSYPGYGVIKPHDVYLLAVGNNITGPGSVDSGNLIMGSTTGNIVMFVGAPEDANVIAKIDSTGFIPGANVAYSLGSSTRQWKDLWVSNNTIYLGGTALGVDASGNLTVNGNVVSGGGGGNVNLGNFVFSGNSLFNLNGGQFTNGDLSHGHTAALILPANGTTDNIQLTNTYGNVSIYTGSNSSITGSWSFTNDGNLAIPPNGWVNVNSGGIKNSLNEDFYIRGSDNEQDGWSIYNVIDDGAGNQLTRTQLQYNRFSVYTDVSGNNYSFDFREGGEFDVPKSIRGPVGGNLVISIGDQPSSNTFIDLQTRSYVGDALISNIRIANPNVTISTAGGAYNWAFDGTGNLILPPSGNIVGATANNTGYLSWVGNSSGDGNGYTTMKLVPDDTRESSDQYLIIDPTAPGHIHIRAGGTQDNSNADLFLGGENTYFKVNAGANNEARISANSYSWIFGADSILTVPNEGVIRSIQDTVTLQSYDIFGNTYSARLGTTGGFYLETTEYPSGWLYITNNVGNADINSPSGNINIAPAFGVANGPGKSLTLRGGDADQSDFYTGVGGSVNIVGGLGGFNDGGGGGPGGNINITAGTSSDPAGHAGNVNINAGNYAWKFTNGGKFKVQEAIEKDGNPYNFLDLIPNDRVTVGADGNVNLGSNWGTNFGSNVTQYWVFDYNGNLTLPSNTSTINYANGTSILSGLGGGSATQIVNGNTSVSIPTEGGDIVFQRLNSNYGRIGTGLAIGYIAGNLNQGTSAVALGTGAGTENQGYHAVAVGWNVGQYNQGAGAIAIGENPGFAAQGNLAIAIGTVAGRASQGSYAIAMGVGAGYTAQTANAVAIGTRAGQDTQGENAVAVGIFAGNNSQGGGAVAVGPEAGKSNQGVQATAVGIAAGSRLQGNGSVALGSFAGQYDQKDFAIAIGSGAAANNQGYGAIAIGVESTTVNQGDYSIAIGFTASNGNIQPNNSIIIDATNSQLAATGPGLFVSPVRYDTGNVANVAYYNAVTKEITYAPAPAGGNYGNANVAGFLASYGSNTIVTTGNISAGYFIGNGALLTGISAGTNYGDANVSALLASYGSNSIVTTGNITGGNITSRAGANIVLGNATSQLRQLGSNALVSLSGSVTLTPDTAASALNGVIIGGSGYLLAPNGARNLTLNYNSDSGHVGLQANATVGSAGSGGTLNVAGTIVTGANVLVGGITNNTAFPNTVAKFSSNIDSYSQLVLQNRSVGTDATTDVVATANNGTDTTFFIDMGIAGNTYDNASPNNSLGTLLFANDSYLYAQGNTAANVGGNLVIGASTAGKVVKIFANGINSSSTVATFSNLGIDMTGNVTTTGNVTVTANVVAGNIVTTGSGGNISGVNVLYANSIVLSGNAAITMSSRPAMRVYGIGSTPIGVNTTLTTSHFTIDYNQNSNLDGTSGVFTAPVAGLYQVTLNARVGTNNGTNQIGVFKNNNTSGGANVICFWESDTNTGTATHFGTSGVVNLAVGDNLRARVVLGNIQFDGNDSWTVTYIG